MTMTRVGIAVTLCVSLLSAKPSGHDVAHGQADVQALQNLLQITTSDKAIINWKEFASEAGEIIRFVQPSGSSAVLNRVTGGNTSTLYGDLQANGQVYLVNPNGIVIGQHARIDAGAFTASTFDVLDSDFIEGSAMRFFGDSKAGVINLGMIKTSAGDCSLISFQVENDGTIEAAGKASLVASNKVILKPHDLQGIYIASEQDAPYMDNPYLLAFNQTIEKDALHFKKDDTGVFLMVNEPVATVAGQIAAESIAILGDYVQVLDQSSIAAQNILIGGDFQGINASLPHARQTYVAKEARLSADGVEKGGKVIVWGTDAAGFYGDISAKPQGFVEISSHGFLDPQGMVDTGGGTFLIDPIDVNIINNAGVDVNVTFPVAPTPPPCPGGGPISYTFSASPATVDNTRLAAFLGCNNVTIATNQAGAGTGNIAVPVGAPVVWNSAFSLTLDTTGTAGTISIRSDIQNSGTGGVFLNSNTGLIQIGNILGPQLVSVGSSDGPTTINAPLANVLVQGAQIIGSDSQLGFFTASGATSTGPISVTCNNLTVQGFGTLTSAQIGHGRTTTTLNTNSSTTAAATITINATGNVLVQSTPIAGDGALAMVGHGSRTYDANLAPPNNAGNISIISSAGSITVTTGPAAIQTSAKVGNSPLGVGVAGPNLPTVSGNITLQAPAGNINLISNGNYVIVGHGSRFISGVSYTGDVDIVCSGNLALTCAVNCDAWIGMRSTWNTGSHNLRATVGNDILIQGGDSAFIGVNANCTVSFNGDTEIVAGRDIIMNQSIIGGISLGTLVGVPPVLNNNTFIAAGRDITGSTIGANPSGLMFIEGPGNFSIAAGRDITLTANPTFFGAFPIVMQTRNTVTGGNAAFRARACGNITAQNGATGTVHVGGPIFGPIPYSVEIQADGDIQLASIIGPTGSGSILVEADANIPAAALWNYTGTNLTSICGQPLSTPITATNLLPAPINAASTACTADGFGAFRVVTAPSSPLNLSTFQTTSGNITLHSAGRRVDSTLQDINIGTVGITTPGTLNIVTTSGNIDVSGSIATDGFNNITLTNAANPWTSGNIYIRASNDLTQNTVVATSGAGRSISLIADSDASGAGTLTLTQNVTTNNGPILLDAGFAAGSGTSSINQSGGQISSAGSPITAQAVGSITLSGAATSVTSLAGPISATAKTGSITATQNVVTTSGNIAMSAGANIDVLTAGSVVSSAGGSITMNAGNDITVNGDPTSISSTTGNISTTAGNNTNVTTNVSTAGSILMISGLNMFLLSPTTNITSSASSVDLVVDNDFPTPPGFGPGFFSAVAGSQVNSGAGSNLRIFTAQQGLNQIDPAALFNGVSVTAFGVPGTIFNNTAYEQWCTYYPSPFGGVPFTLFYKDCEQIIVQTGNKVVSDMLFNLNVENMWVEELLSPLIPPEVWRFMLIYGPGINAYTKFAHERYWLSRRNIHFIHYPYVYKENKPLTELVPAETATKTSQRKKSLFQPAT